jgi:outer membrane biogenesis lipoprotein LolB
VRHLAFVLLMLLASCGGRRFHVEDVSEEQLRLRMAENFNSFSRIEVSWRAVISSRKLGQVPCRLDLDWSDDSLLLVIRSPFGGELARLRGRPEGFAAATGKSLPGWLERAARAIDSPAVSNLLDRGIDALKDRGSEVFQVELADPMLASILDLAGPELPGDWLRRGLLSRKELGPWLWGAVEPDPASRWQPDSLCFIQGDRRWRLEEHGFVTQATLDDWQIDLENYRRRQKCWLPEKLIYTRADGEYRMVLQQRSIKLEK